MGGVCAGLCTGVREGKTPNTKEDVEDWPGALRAEMGFSRSRTRSLSTTTSATSSPGSPEDYPVAVPSSASLAEMGATPTAPQPATGLQQPAPTDVPSHVTPIDDAGSCSLGAKVTEEAPDSIPLQLLTDVAHKVDHAASLTTGPDGAAEAPQPFVQPPALVVPINPEVNPHWQNQLLGMPVAQTAPMYYFPAGASVFPTDPSINPLYWLQLQMVPVPESAPEPAPAAALAGAASSTEPEPAPAPVPTRPARKGTRLVNKAIGKKPTADA
ncbi:unnamed protein product [Symbiodinium sp. CCMP2592]|nr:unnamed protein product [Symbiodinium sp. CCMP2592]